MDNSVYECLITKAIDTMNSLWKDHSKIGLFKFLLCTEDTSDGEDSNSEKTLASKVCTFISSGSNFMEQHWYFCYTCDLTVSKAAVLCAKFCHRGHRVVYSRSSRFFCDCGAGVSGVIVNRVMVPAILLYMLRSIDLLILVCLSLLYFSIFCIYIF